MNVDALERTPPASGGGAPAASWSWLRLFLFRFAALYFVLYALPFPFSNLWQVVAQVIEWSTKEGQEIAWVAAVQDFFTGSPEEGFARGRYDGWWRAITSSVGDAVGIEVIHQRTGSGDTAHDWIKAAVGFAAAAVLALLWSVVRRHGAHPALARWLHLGVRWYLGFWMLVYGLIKLYAGQFIYPSLQAMMLPLGDMSPMGLVWDFIGFSKPYEVFSGIGEALGGLLLFARRTSLLGSFVTVAVMTNVVALNWMYDVPVKLFSSHLLLFALALMVPEARRLVRMFLTNRPVPPADHTLVANRGLRVALTVFGTAWLALHLYSTHEGNMAAREQRRAFLERPPLYGVWLVDGMRIDGVDVEPGDPRRWELLAIDARERGWIRWPGGRTEWIRLKPGDDADTLQVAALAAGAAGPDADEPSWSTWSVERGEQTVQRLITVPKSMQGYRRQVDEVAPMLVLTGPWQESELEVRVVAKRFELERGFHWIQELPINR